MTSPNGWVADPTVPWQILLSAQLAEDPDPERLRSGAVQLARAVGWAGPAPVLHEDDEVGPLLRRMAAAPEHGVPVEVGVAGRELVVRAHHATLDGLGLVAALGVLLDAQVSSSAKGLPHGPARGVARSAAARVAEAAVAPPAVVRPTARGAAVEGDVFAVRALAGRFGTAEVALAAAEVLADRVGRGAVVVAVGLSRTGGAAPRLADDSALVRLRDLSGRSVEEVRILLRETPAQGSPGAAGTPGALATAMRWGMRLLSARLGSTVLVSHLGAVQAPGIERLSFYPVTAGGSGLSLGVVGLGDRTTVTLRARARQHDEEGLRTILEPLCARLGG